MTISFGDEIYVRLETDSTIGPFEDGLYETRYVITEKNGDIHRGVVTHGRNEPYAEIAKRAHSEWRKSSS